MFSTLGLGLYYISVCTTAIYVHGGTPRITRDTRSLEVAHLVSLETLVHSRLSHAQHHARPRATAHDHSRRMPHARPTPRTTVHTPYVYHAHTTHHDSPYYTCFQSEVSPLARWCLYSTEPIRAGGEEIKETNRSRLTRPWAWDAVDVNL